MEAGHVVDLAGRAAVGFTWHWMASMGFTWHWMRTT